MLHVCSLSRDRKAEVGLDFVFFLILCLRHSQSSFKAPRGILFQTQRCWKMFKEKTFVSSWLCFCCLVGKLEYFLVDVCTEQLCSIYISQKMYSCLYSHTLRCNVGMWFHITSDIVHFNHLFTATSIYLNVPLNHEFDTAIWVRYSHFSIKIPPSVNKNSK